MDWATTTARGYKKHLNFGIWCDLYQLCIQGACEFIYDNDISYYGSGSEQAFICGT